MVDEKEILKQYSYKATSNLVIERDRRRRTIADSNVGPLKVAALPGRMGDKARPAPSEPSEKASGLPPENTEPAEFAKPSDDDIVDAVDELDIENAEESYIPTTQVSKRAFEALLAFISAKLGDQPRDLLRGAAEETIALMKSDTHPLEKRREQFSEVLGIKLTSEEFSKVTLYTDRMADFEMNAGGSRSDQGLTVLIDEDAEETDNATGKTMDPDKARLQAELNQLSGNVGLEDVLNMDESLQAPALPEALGNQAASETAESFLSTIVSQYLSEHDSSKWLLPILGTLTSSSDDQACENKLLSIIGFDNMELAAELMQRRGEVYRYSKSGSADADVGMDDDGEMENVEDVSNGPQNINSHMVRREVRKRPRSPLAGDHTADRSMQARSHTYREVDIDGLVAYRQHSRPTNRDCKLPEGSHHIEGKEYEEWYIPPSTSSLQKRKDSLVPIERLPEWARPAFPGTTRFNRMQSVVYDCAFLSMENMLVCAPTGAGKTNVAMLATVKALEKIIQSPEGGPGRVPCPAVVYVAPMKALVAEVVLNFSTKLSPLGISVRELTGDVSVSAQELKRSHVIVCTPEKWDIVSRKGGASSLNASLQLLIIDEVHLLNDGRGPVLESVVARSRRSCVPGRPSTRIVGLSATLPNSGDVASFLAIDEQKGLFAFDSSYRPCPLQQCFMGISSRKAMKRFQLQNSLVYERAVHQVQNSQQVIIFVHSRKETVSTCKYFIERAIEGEETDHFLKPGSASEGVIQSELGRLSSNDLRGVLEYGLAVHHAGMARSDREVVEAFFEQGHVRVLVSTATLAWGVNLPAHAVIVKGTQVYSPELGRWTDLSPMDVVQMMGRAGRPQFDTFGEGIIVTAKSDVMFYLSVLNNNIPVESQFLSRLTDLLNAEVAAASVSSVAEGAEWLGYTFLHVRMLKSPNLYGVSAEEISRDPTLKRHRENLIHSAAIKLHRLGLLLYRQDTGELETTTLGRIAADFYVTHTTMSTFVDGLHQGITDVDLLRLVSISGEFEHVRVREEEKLELARLAERAPIPIKESLDESSAKTNVLLQAYISRLSLDGLALRADMTYISQSAARLTRALVLTSIALKHATAFSKCQNLFKNVTMRQWSTQTPLRQFGFEISRDTIRRIERKDVQFERYYDLEVQALQDLTKDKDAGRTLHRLIHCLPRVQLEASARPISRSSLEIRLMLASDFRFDKDLHRREEGFWISVEDGDSEKLLYAQLHHMRPFVGKQHSVSFVVGLSSPPPNHYLVRCASDSWIAPGAVAPISLQELVLPEKFEAFSQVPEKISTSVSKAFDSVVLPQHEDTSSHQASIEMLTNVRSYYRGRYAKLPFLVGHLFSSLFDSAENAVLATLPTTERDVCGELCVARLFVLKPAAVAVWVVARGAVALEQKFQWLRAGIAKALGLNVVKVESFESSSSQNLQRAGTLIVAGVEYWDQFSRKWRHKKERKVLSKVELMILDNTQLLASPAGEGAALEAAASRMRYIAATTGSKGPVRIVALSDPIANAASVGHWLGVSPSFVFSFRPKDFTHPLKIDVLPALRRRVDYESSSLIRTLHGVMRKRAWRANLQAIVFLSSRGVARKAIEEINSTGALDSFLISSESTSLASTGFLDATPGEGLSRKRVVCAFVDCSMPQTIREDVEKAFADKSCHVLFATPDYAWHTNVVAPLVVIGGTKRIPDNVDLCSTGELDRTDILRMACRAHGVDGTHRSGTVVILTEESNLDLYKRVMEPQALESKLPERFADHLNAEIASGVVETKQDAVDYLTWTFFYHRLPKNPNYYGLRGLAPDEVSRHLSELVELSLSDLEGSKCVAVEGDEDIALGALNLGFIASHYYVRHETVEFFAASVNPRVKLRSILDILSFAWEFRGIQMRRSDIDMLTDIASKTPFEVEPESGASTASFSSRHKIHLLLQAHLSRIELDADLQKEQRMIVVTCIRLLRAFVDVIASAGWLKPALVAVELSQMLVQGVWDLEVPLLQLPYMTAGIARDLKDGYAVSDVFEFLDMEPEDRTKALTGFTNDQLREIAAAACEAYPNLDDISTDGPERQVLSDGTTAMQLTVHVKRSEDSDEFSNGKLPIVVAPRYPEAKTEGWWMILGIPSKNTLLTLKYFNLRQNAAVKLSYSVDSIESEREEVQIYLVSDSYIDCDQEETISGSS